jgi:hypothetical protein
MISSWEMASIEAIAKGRLARMSLGIQLSRACLSGRLRTGMASSDGRAVSAVVMSIETMNGMSFVFK